ncbi:MAG: RNA polymerase subunit sigma-24 [Oscillospiraceae bacterium]|nr:RNA polymerase subunit sigma-24 [Oscillospiraceae bacterium]
MKNYRESDYALNKYSEGIVYRFANETIELTLEDFLRKTPGATEAAFLKWKAFSDSDYLLQAQKDNAQTKKNISIGALEETAACGWMSLEDEYNVAEDRERNLHIVEDFFCAVKLTEKQKQRFLLHYCRGLTFREIALREGVHFTSVRDSIEQVTQKFREFYLKRK